MKAGLQLYSVKEEIAKDFIGTLKRVAELGYEGVEFAGYGNLSAAEMKKALTDFGLRSIGSHISLERITAHLDEEIAYHLELGTKYLILPWAEYKTADDVLKVADALNTAALGVRGTGLTVGYHNHSQEFAKFDGEYILDTLMKNTSDDVVFELDVYWAAVADVDPIAYIKAHKKIQLIHIKELLDYETKKNTDVGSGVLDFPAIIAAAKAGGANEFIVEQERTDGSIWDSVAKGMDYLKTL
ncbi:MAG: sugar phosphate isomerase/epimerase [Clostridiales bacterium]|jgi:sugar phosphate isomerase/epimerase|nr:sugar phosphate isomerase/epimerase [Clostridiales bacterium]